jgi:hypothetical protein
MKFHRELYRTILLVIEEKSKRNQIQTYDPHDFGDYGAEMISGHVKLLEQAGFLTPAKELSGDIVCAGGITHRGFEFLNAVRDEDIWSKTDEAAAKAGAFTLEIIEDIALGLIKTQVKKQTGVEI